MQPLASKKKVCSTEVECPTSDDTPWANNKYFSSGVFASLEVLAFLDHRYVPTGYTKSATTGTKVLKTNKQFRCRRLKMARPLSLPLFYFLPFFDFLVAGERTAEKATWLCRRFSKLSFLQGQVSSGNARFTAPFYSVSTEDSVTR